MYQKTPDTENIIAEKRSVSIMLSKYTNITSNLASQFIPGRRINSKHIQDCMTYISIWSGLVVTGGAILFVLILIYTFDIIYNKKFAIGGLTAYLAVYGAIFGYAIRNVGSTLEQASKRLGLVDMFASDILAICNVIEQMDLLERFKILSSELNYPGIDASAYQARNENYFEIWQKSSHELGALEKESIKRITRFYTYLKASRDATRELAHWNENTPEAFKKRGAQGIVILLSLCLKSARLSLDSLLEHEDEERNFGFRYIARQNIKAHEILIEIGVDKCRIKRLGLDYTEYNYNEIFDDNNKYIIPSGTPSFSATQI